ncbi:hypothetical protein V6N11_061032 [Hibiscus sabdariffa]|uniref:Uncharacterized protein n=1 Tax=Hibiscus sabdariffa TaxID=183260 RepID=A0ABR2QSF3_9ROSI
MYTRQTMGGNGNQEKPYNLRYKRNRKGVLFGGVRFLKTLPSFISGAIFDCLQRNEEIKKQVGFCFGLIGF